MFISEGRLRDFLHESSGRSPGIIICRLPDFRLNLSVVHDHIGPVWENVIISKTEKWAHNHLDKFWLREPTNYHEKKRFNFIGLNFDIYIYIFLAKPGNGINSVNEFLSYIPVSRNVQNNWFHIFKRDVMPMNRPHFLPDKKKLNKSSVSITHCSRS